MTNYYLLIKNIFENAKKELINVFDQKTFINKAIKIIKEKLIILSKKKENQYPDIISNQNIDFTIEILEESINFKLTNIYTYLLISQITNDQIKVIIGNNKVILNNNSTIEIINGEIFYYQINNSNIEIINGEIFYYPIKPVEYIDIKFKIDNTFKKGLKI